MTQVHIHEPPPEASPSILRTIGLTIVGLFFFFTVAGWMAGPLEYDQRDGPSPRRYTMSDGMAVLLCDDGRPADVRVSKIAPGVWMQFCPRGPLVVGE